jgi:hypothetical protein
MCSLDKAEEHLDLHPGSPASVSERASDQASLGIEPEDFLDDEGYAESISTSYASSIASDMRRGIEENGRLYAAYGQHKPWVPVDDSEVRYQGIYQLDSH